MKKMMLLGVLLVCAAAVGSAQESRQDVSASAIGEFGPEIHGLGVKMHTLGALGFLGSYRYSVTPRSGLEVNYMYLQNSEKFLLPGHTNPSTGVPAWDYVHTRQEEISAAYVYSRNYKNFNPFVEAGGGGMIFTPMTDYATTQLRNRQNLNIGALFGGGLAYEISPSFDIRAEYRGFLVKAPSFGTANGFTTNRYEWLSIPAIGIAYHF